MTDNNECRVVPVEPTEAMMTAGMAKIIHGGVYNGLKNAFRAMASAAPVIGRLDREKVVAVLEAHIDARLAGPRDDWAEVTGVDEAVDAILALTGEQK